MRQTYPLVMSAQAIDYILTLLGKQPHAVVRQIVAGIEQQIAEADQLDQEKVAAEEQELADLRARPVPRVRKKKEPQP